MRVLIIKLIIAFVFLTSCENKKSIKKEEKFFLKINLEKVIVINLDEVCVTYFKVKVENKKDSIVVLLDNNLNHYRKKRLKPEKEGFYIRNNKNDSLITLGIDNYNFYKIGAKEKGYCYISAINLKHSFLEKDSLLLKKYLSNCVIEYNGKNLDLDKIKKSIDISQKEFDELKKNKNNLIAFKDSLSILIPKTIQFKYLNEMPIQREEWDNL